MKKRDRKAHSATDLRNLGTVSSDAIATISSTSNFHLNDRKKEVRHINSKGVCREQRIPYLLAHSVIAQLHHSRFIARAIAWEVKRTKREREREESD